MNKRLQAMIGKSLIPNRGGCFIDAYNQSVNAEIAGTITTRVDASNMSFITEPIGCAMRGRNPENPSERGRSNGKYKQRIEMGSSPTLDTNSKKRPRIQGEATSYRIRKLTPRECFRLMGVAESDIDKIQQSGVSQSQQYKMAGNSIVVDCLFHIFRKMFVDTGQESQQLSLF